jgi:class 3 adenylate cyclase
VAVREARTPAGEETISMEVHRRVKDCLAQKNIVAVCLELELKGFGAPVVAFRVRAGKAARAGAQ